MKKRGRFPVLRFIGVWTVGYLFFNFFWFFANTLNFWPAYILALLTVVMCVKAMQTLLDDWRGKVPHTAPDSPLPTPERKVTINHAWSEHLGVWIYWTEKPTRQLMIDEVPGKALAKILQNLKLESPNQYELVDAPAIRFNTEAG